MAETEGKGKTLAPRAQVRPAVNIKTNHRFQELPADFTNNCLQPNPDESQDTVMAP